MSELKKQLEQNKQLQRNINYLATMITAIEIDKEAAGEDTKELDTLLDLIFGALALPSNDLKETMTQISAIHKEMRRVDITADQLIKAVA